jgi:hypothetical protein
MVRLCRKLSFRTAPPHYSVSSSLCFVFWAFCSLHMSHIFDTNSQCHPGHLPCRSVRVFFPKSCSHQSARQTYHHGFLAGPPSLGTWGEPAALSPLSHRHFAMHVSTAVFYVLQMFVEVTSYHHNVIEIHQTSFPRQSSQNE